MESRDLSAMTASDGGADTRIGQLTHGGWETPTSGAKYRRGEIQTLTKQEMKQKRNKWDDDCVWAHVRRGHVKGEDGMAKRNGMAHQERRVC